MRSKNIRPILELLDKGEIFSAYDKVEELLKSNTLNMTEEISARCCSTRALLLTASYTEAREKITPIINHHFAEIKGWVHLSEDFLKEKLLKEEIFSSESLPKSSSVDLREIGGIYKEIFCREWDTSPQQSIEDLALARCFLLASYAMDPCLHTAAEAACLSWMAGDQVVWKILADRILQNSCSLDTAQSEEDHFIFYQSKGYAFLLNQDTAKAKEFFEKAYTTIKKSFSLVVNLRAQLCMLQRAGLWIPAEIFELLQPPVVVIFTGHRFDYYGDTTAVFPAFLETEVKKNLEEKIRELNITIGYSSVSCGADILFAEILMEQGKELNIVLPFDKEDFIQQNILLGGARWEKKFHKVLQYASSVVYATEENFLHHSMLYRFGNKMLHGTAETRCQYLGTSPHLLAIWHSESGMMPGGTGEFVHHWKDTQRLHLIDLKELLQPFKEAWELSLRAGTKNIEEIRRKKDLSLPENITMPRVIKCMLFSDLAGFSKLSDKYITYFLECMNRLATELKKLPVQPESLNTWGDACFAIMDNPYYLAQYALHFNYFIKEYGNKGFPTPLRARISLDAGPVFHVKDPFLKTSNFFGEHINRGARLEPVTVAGQVFATQQFVSLLQAECSNLKIENPKVYHHFPIECHYVGIIPLAKYWGMQAVYRLEGPADFFL